MKNYNENSSFMLTENRDIEKAWEMLSKRELDDAFTLLRKTVSYFSGDIRVQYPTINHRDKMITLLVNLDRRFRHTDEYDDDDNPTFTVEFRTFEKALDKVWRMCETFARKHGYRFESYG
jgi:hypothetical protein